MSAPTAVPDLSFERLAAAHRRELEAHCYRMLGSAADAEDAVQETLLRAWRGLPGFAGRSSLRTWLYRIATNVCLRALERRPRRVLPVDFGPAHDPHDALAEAIDEPVWLEPVADAVAGDGPASPEARYEQRESVELAFVAALQHLPHRQRAVLLLRDVLGFAPAEIAEVLATTPAAVSSALQRAHEAIDRRLPERSQQATLRALGDERVRGIVDRYMAAWEAADVDAIVAMLSDDATLAMPPRPGWYGGRDAVRAFLLAHPFADRAQRWRLVPARAGGQLAVGIYEADAAGGPARAHALTVLTLDAEGRVAAQTAFFLEPGSFRRYGLPAELPAA